MATLFCPVCGTENPATRQFCRKCASDLRAPAPDPNAAVAPEPAPVPIRPIVIGAGIALLLVAVIVAAIVLLGGSPAASPSPAASSSPSTAPTDAPATASAAPSPTAAPIATEEATPAQTSTTESRAPGASPKPIVDSFSGPSRASCTGTNGTSNVGYIHLEWTASNTSGVRLSIDPPSANNAYGAGYDDYPAVGSADVPFTCDPPNSDGNGMYHLYVVTTLHDRGYFAYRFIKVYLRG